MDNPTPKRGRPVSGQPWRRKFGLPLSPEERAILASAAQADGRPLAAWIRDAALRQAKRFSGRQKNISEGLDKPI